MRKQAVSGLIACPARGNEAAAQTALRMIEGRRISAEAQTASVHRVVRESCGARVRGVGRDVA